MRFIESKIAYELLIIIVLMLVAVSFPILALTVPWRPETESLDSWFQRSGSVMTIVCLLIDSKLFSIYRWLHFNNKERGNFREIRRNYAPPYKSAAALALLLTGTGTVIWGYGDLILAALAVSS
ncbi:hypothetical protein [Vibrio metschnikovii]|uniref:hypothetical protein n=1 Tax=Vibrio metschnikovii TaxID=28172 RepID=UPI001C30BAB1|nr:hypothetical protein [Vibrio metschnikovii]